MNLQAVGIHGSRNAIRQVIFRTEDLADYEEGQGIDVHWIGQVHRLRLSGIEHGPDGLSIAWADQ